MIREPATLFSCGRGIVKFSPRRGGFWGMENREPGGLWDKQYTPAGVKLFNTRAPLMGGV